MATAQAVFLTLHCGTPATQHARYAERTPIKLFGGEILLSTLWVLSRERMEFFGFFFFAFDLFTLGSYSLDKST